MAVGFFVKNWRQWYGDGHYDRGPADDEYRELFLRWFQYGAFLPMFRVHGTDFPREVWQFGVQGDVVYDTLVNFIRLRYRLLPYLYSLAHMVTKEDYTFMRPVAADFPDDKKALSINDQFMLGPWLMVCPVYEYGARSRNVYLPKGEKWYSFWTGKRIESGSITAEAPLEQIPVFV
ncbi:MAG: TIM-barrel domain-containing protein [Acetivibrionales bacterium]